MLISYSYKSNMLVVTYKHKLINSFFTNARPIVQKSLQNREKPFNIYWSSRSKSIDCHFRRLLDIFPSRLQFHICNSSVRVQNFGKFSKRGVCCFISGLLKINQFFNDCFNLLNSFNNSKVPRFAHRKKVNEKFKTRNFGNFIKCILRLHEL